MFNELQTRNRDLTEALEQQTATSEILRVISQSPTDVLPVFDTIAAAVLRLCRATSANVYTFDGELIHLVPLVNHNPGYIEAMRRVFPRLSLSAKKESGAFFKLITRPGVWLQNITTKEPDDSQLEVAIQALKESLKLEPQTSEPELAPLS